MRRRGKNSLPLTPKTVHLLRLPRTIGKRKGDDNKFFSPILRANHQCLAATLHTAFPGIAYQWVVFFPEKATGFSFRRLNVERLVPGLAVAWIENNSPSQNQPSHNSNPVPNCLTAQKRQIRFSTPLGEVRSGIGENSPTFDEHCSIES